MTNTKKIIILLVLLAVFSVFLFKLVVTMNEQEEIEAKKQPTVDEVLEIPGEPLITLVADLNQYLNKFSYGESIFNEAVSIAKNTTNKYFEENVVITDATISNIEMINTGTGGLYDSVVMFNIETILTKSDGEKITDSSNYVIFYLRTDENGDSCYHLSSLTKAQLEEKYTDISKEYDNNIFIAACMNEKMNFLKNSPEVTEEDMPTEAYSKAVAFAESVDGVNEVLFENHTVQNDMSTRIYEFLTDNEEVKIMVFYLYFEDTDTWTFHYTTYIE